MELRELTAFREVARQSSFSRAASRLGYVQSTVSAQIQSLERDLDVRLFDRLTRAITLTAAGQALLPYAERLIELATEAQAAVAVAETDDGELVGTISVSAPESLLTYRVPAVLSHFRGRHPGVTIRLHPTAVGGLRGETRRAIASGAVDLAFVLDTPLDVAGFGSEILVHEAISVIVASGHRLASARAELAPADLDGVALLLPEAPDSGCAYRGQFERQLAEGHVRTDGALEFASIETVKQCVIAEMGVAVLPSMAVEADVVAGRLVRLPWREPFTVYTQLVWNARRSISPALGAFMASARLALQPGPSARPRMAPPTRRDSPSGAGRPAPGLRAARSHG